MRVLVTGGSGYVGSHTVAALLAAGHRPRILVRSPDKARRVLGVLGVRLNQTGETDETAEPAETAAVEVRTGDMLDADAAVRALDGCDAVIHAAAAIDVSGRADKAAALVETNVTGTRNIVGAAADRGLDPVIHVSSIGIFVPPTGPVITPDGGFGAPRTGYGRSKIAAETYARDLQDGGAPVTIVYPGGVCGPHQPSLDALMSGLASGLGTVWPISPGGVSVIDVRDLAAALTRMVEPGLGARRLMLGGHYLTWRELVDRCDAVTGVRHRRVPVPGRTMFALGTLLDAVKRVRDFDYPLTRDAAEFMVRLVPTDDRPTLDALDLTLRPVEETLADSLRWLAGNGHLAAAKIGRLAGTPATA